VARATPTFLVERPRRKHARIRWSISRIRRA
jgi:hypothetical protein